MGANARGRASGGANSADVMTQAEKEGRAFLDKTQMWTSWLLAGVVPQVEMAG